MNYTKIKKDLEREEHELKNLKIRFDELSNKGILNLNKKEQKEIRSINKQLIKLKDEQMFY